jgi:hypothetical protein
VVGDAQRSEPDYQGAVVFPEKCSGFNSLWLFCRPIASVRSAAQAFHAILEGALRSGCFWICLYAASDGANKIGRRGLRASRTGCSDGWYGHRTPAQRRAPPHGLVSAAAEFGKGARAQDLAGGGQRRYFSPGLSPQLADSFRSGGGRADFCVLPASGREGHWLAEMDAGVRLAGVEVDRALPALAARAAIKR